MDVEWDGMYVNLLPTSGLLSIETLRYPDIGVRVRVVYLYT